MQTTNRSIAAMLAVLVTGALALAAGCYSPSIKDGGFKCASGSKPCPDGFTCGSDMLCHNMPVTTTDAGSCTIAAVTPLCQDPPRAGQDCNPACQTGCMCGRCNVVGKDARCTAVGAKMLGQTCDPSADDCGAGLICLLEACGNRLGRCYRHCTKNDQCNGTICQIPIQDMSNADTKYLACDVAPQDCDPVSNAGCPSPALNCYLTSASQTICDCPNKMGKTGDPCAIYSDCAPGYMCIAGVAGLTGPHCQPICTVANPACQAPTHCIASGGKYGYCGI